MTKLLDVKPFRQSPSCCGPSSLKMVLGYYNIHKSETELVQLTKCTLSKGTTAKNIFLTAKKLGLNCEIKDNSKLSDLQALLKKDIPIIVNWFSTDEGHYSVVVGMDKESIYMQDPELGHIRTMNLKTFMRVWFDFRDAYIKTSKDLILRRMIVIYR